MGHFWLIDAYSYNDTSFINFRNAAGTNALPHFYINNLSEVSITQKDQRPFSPLILIDLLQSHILQAVFPHAGTQGMKHQTMCP